MAFEASGISASGSQAQSDGTDYTNALVAAGGNLSTSSGRDTNVKGAQVQGTRWI